MLAGISTACFYPQTPEESLAQIMKLGPACVEIFLNAEQEFEPSYLRGLRTMADAGGIRIVSVHPYLSPLEPMLFFSNYPRRFEQGIRQYRRFYRAVNLLGADTLVFHGDYDQGHLSQESYFERFGQLWEDARQHGVSLCQENVERCKSRRVDFFIGMRRALPQAEFILDIKQAIRAGQDIHQMAEVMAGRIKHIHISDHNGAESCLPPGQGELDICELLDDIAGKGFDGGVIVELYRENFKGIVELSRGFQHLSHILSTIP